MHKTLEEHVKDVCSNKNCRKPRNGEELKSHFHKSNHYISWECESCGSESWWKSDKLSSGVKHMNID